MLLPFFSIVPFVFCFAFMPTFHDGSYVESKVMLFSIVALLLLNKFEFKRVFNLKTPKEKVFLFGMFLYMAISLLSHSVHGDNMNAVRTILYLFLFFCLVDVSKIKQEYISISVILGGFFIAIPACWEYFHLGFNRVGVYLNEIIFAHVTFIIYLLNSFFFFKCKGLFRLLHFFASVIALICIVMSGTRGVWLAVPVSWFLLGLFLYKQDYFNKKIVISLMVVFLVIGGVSFGEVAKRYDHAVNDISLYQDGNVNSSVGGRFYIWKASWLMIKENPIFGVGMDNFQSKIDEYVNDGEILKQSQYFPHAHNEFINSLVMKGIVGLAAYLFFLFSPLFFIKKKWVSDFHSVLLVSVISSYFIFALTDVPLMYPVNIYMFVITISFILSRR